MIHFLPPLTTFLQPLTLEHVEISPSSPLSTSDSAKMLSLGHYINPLSPPTASISASTQIHNPL